MLSTIDMRKTIISLFIVGIWLLSSATGGQIFSELKRISGSLLADGEGRLMRFRTCHDEIMVQCEPGEVIRIVNASYAATRLHPENPIRRCSDVSFQHEFDCIQPANSQYIKNITGRCNGNQSCDLVRRRASLNCSSLVVSCCVEIYYTCEQRKDVAISSLFMASDSAGNVYVSLHCNSSDLSVISIVQVFSSSREFHEEGICYKLSQDIGNVSKRCANNHGCSDVLVTGAKGCGEISDIYNYGVYIYYTCNRSQINDSQRRTTIIPGIKMMTTIISMTFAAYAWVTVAVLLVVAVLLSFVVGGIVRVKRRRTPKSRSEKQTGIANQEISFPATGEGHGGEVSAIIVQDSDLETSQCCEINDLEVAAKQKSTDPERGRNNGTTMKTDKMAQRGKLSEGPSACPEPGKDYVNFGLGKEEPKAVYEHLDQFGKSVKPVYEQLNLS